MHGGTLPAREMFYGCDGQHVAIRLDGTASGGKIEVEFDTGFAEPETAVGRITELRVPLAGQRFRVHVSHNGLAPMTIPAQGWIEIGECMALAKRVLTDGVSSPK
jgi:hypothetical protein